MSAKKTRRKLGPHPPVLGRHGLRLAVTDGRSRSGIDAMLAACQLRLRPIIMPSFAFIHGLVPLILSVGAGEEMRRTLGTAVFAGMLGLTLFGIFLTPVFYYVIQWFVDRRNAAAADEEG